MLLNFFCKRYLSVIAISFAAFSTLAPAPAHARGTIIVNTGEELFEVADFPQNMVDEYPGLKDYKVSYACQRFGIFWANVWTWDCKLMAGNISTNTIADIPQEFMPTLQQQYPFDKAQRNFWNKYGIITMLSVFILLCVMQVVIKSPATEA
ncbi:hypothetical protein NIES4071_58880 [Calothrix sp. NIES-4071]|nr:hypothetical protein NIES4071_58880 [Calothrix sp. NIES-4071]BAZ60195.1 hypothetical protein NIES4105_58830 [Calothrix sp. NIES-4105]